MYIKKCLIPTMYSMYTYVCNGTCCGNILPFFMEYLDDLNLQRSAPRLNPSTAAMRLAGAVSPDNKVDFHGTTRSKRRKVREKLPQRTWLKDEGGTPLP